MKQETSGFMQRYFHSQHQLYHGDALEIVRTFEDNRFDLVITSPLYNVGKEYETKLSIANYLKQQEEIIAELIRVTSPQGSICWQVGNYVEKGEVFPLDVFNYPIFRKHDLRLRNRIIWYFGHGLQTSKRFSGRYETILGFTQSDRYIFNLDEVRVPSKYPGKRHFKGPNKGKPSGNPKGKNPSDIWEIVLHDWEKELWEIPNVKSNHPKKTVHPCQYPIELMERCILALTNPGSWILDPFAGVGSSLSAAIKNNRNKIGVEKEAVYLKLAEERVRQRYEGRLKLRPITRPIHKPSPKDKIAQIPQEWLLRNKGNKDSDS